MWNIQWTNRKWLNSPKRDISVYRWLKRSIRWWNQSVTISPFLVKSDSCYERHFCAWVVFLCSEIDARLTILSNNLLPLGYHQWWHCSSIWRYNLWYISKMNTTKSVKIMLKYSLRFVLQYTIFFFCKFQFQFFLHWSLKFTFWTLHIIRMFLYKVMHNMLHYFQHFIFRCVPASSSQRTLSIFRDKEESEYRNISMNLQNFILLFLTKLVLSISQRWI